MKQTRYLNNLDSFIAACIGFYVIYLYTKYSGVGISPDSIMYASTATNIQAHGSLLTFNKHPITFFPVFYPFFLGLIQFITRVDPIKAGAMIDASLFAGVVFTSGWITSKFLSEAKVFILGTKNKWLIIGYILLCFGLSFGLLKITLWPDNFLPDTAFVSKWLILSVLIFIIGQKYKWMILVAIILSPGLLEIYTYLWSETLFILEVLLFIVAYWRYLQNHSLKWLLIVGIITTIACITRYVGVTIGATGGLLLLLDDRLPIKKKIGHILFYGGVSVSLLVANLVLNKLSTGLSTGTREPAITPFSENLHYFGTVICDWGALSNKTYPYAGLIAAVIFVALIIVLLFKTFKREINSYENIVIAFAIVYSLFMVTWASISRFERIDSRLIAPVFIPLLIACTSWVPDVLRLVKSKARYVLAGVAIVLMVAFEYATYQTDWQRYDDENDYGVPGYSDDGWNKSDFIVYLKQHQSNYKAGVPIYTNADEAVYLFTGMSSTLIPHKFFKADVQKFYTQKHFYLIWFGGIPPNTELLSLQDIMQNKKLVKIGGAKDGEVYYCDER
jgi:hypothetical protein